MFHHSDKALPLLVCIWVHSSHPILILGLNNSRFCTQLISGPSMQYLRGILFHSLGHLRVSLENQDIGRRLVSLGLRIHWQNIFRLSLSYSCTAPTSIREYWCSNCETPCWLILMITRVALGRKHHKYLNPPPDPRGAVPRLRREERPGLRGGVLPQRYAQQLGRVRGQPHLGWPALTQY